LDSKSKSAIIENQDSFKR